MQITMGAKCWDGVRSKTLTEKRIVIPEITTEIEKRSQFDPRLKALLSFAVPIMFVAGGLPPFGMTRAFAAAPEAVPTLALSAGIKEKILHAFDPLIDLVQLLAYPVAGVMIAGGCLFIMVGNRETGMKMLQNAAIGYILVQLSPVFLQLLVGIGGAVV